MKTLLLSVGFAGAAGLLAMGQARAERAQPVTASEHEALAARDEREAALDRQQATQQRERADQYVRRSRADVVKSWTGEEPPGAAKVIEEHEQRAQRYDKMADQAETSAEFHRLRAQELSRQ